MSFGSKICYDLLIGTLSGSCLPISSIRISGPAPACRTGEEEGKEAEGGASGVPVGVGAISVVRQGRQHHPRGVSHSPIKRPPLTYSPHLN